MKIEIDTVKGFRDYLPPESQKRTEIIATAKKIFELYGFLPIETPIIEYDELMRPDSLPNEGEDDAVAERFKLQDRGGRNLGLRYEFTFQLSRILKQNPNLKMPFKRYQIGPVFRDEPIRQGRVRQFTQCDIDIIGDSSINADAECISCISDVLQALNIKDFQIQLNNRKLLNAIIESVQIKNSKQVLRELDKMQKIGEDTVKLNLRKYTTPNQIITLLKILDKPLSFFIENAFDGSEELQELINLCQLYGLKPVFNPYMVRGFAYYTGPIFEFLKEGKTSIVGGGRYDNSVGKFLNREIPAVGISFSIEALSSLCPELSELKTEPQSQVLIISIEEDKESIKLAKSLRKKNISTILTFGQISKQLEYANSQKIPYVIFLGEDEVNNKKFKLKDMTSGEEKLLTEKQLISKLVK
jgi:histidyl-tRNA synthetase